MANDEMAALAGKLSYQTSSQSDSMGKYNPGTSGSKSKHSALVSGGESQDAKRYEDQEATREEPSQEEAI